MHPSIRTDREAGGIFFFSGTTSPTGSPEAEEQAAGAWGEGGEGETRLERVRASSRERERLQLVQPSEREGMRAPRQQYKSAGGGGGGDVTLWRGAGGEIGGATGAREVSAAAFASAAIRGGGFQKKENGSGGSGIPSKFDVLQVEGQDGSQQSAARIQKESTREINKEADASPLEVCKAE